jgi:hypothetical protein
MRAEINPATQNPGIKKDAIIIMKALITRVKNPSVKRFIGKVNSNIIGLTKILRAPKTKTTIMATQKLAREIPGKMYAAIATAKAFINMRTIISISLKNKLITNLNYNTRAIDRNTNFKI